MMADCQTLTAISEREPEASPENVATLQRRVMAMAQQPGPKRSERRRYAGVALVVALTAVLSVTFLTGYAGARPASSAQPAAAAKNPSLKEFGWAIGLNENAIIIAMKHEMTRYAGTKGWKVLYDTGQNADIQPMITAVQAWITEGVPAITIAAFNPSAFAPLARQARAKGTAILAYNSKLRPRDGDVAFPPCDAAVLAAQATVQWIKKHNPTAQVLITSSPRQPEVSCKWVGVRKTIEKQTKATVVAVQEGNNRAEALQVTQATLAAHPDLRVVVATNDDAALGAAQAFKAKGINPKDVFIVGFDGLKEALQQIKQGGYIKADAALNLKRLADKVVDANIKLAKLGPQKKPILALQPPVLIERGSPQLNELLRFYG
jgi:ABC-type sugar transport system substrate-binding protein